MATSGTYDLTSLNTSRVIEHALRRCGKTPASQTPETLKVALESLYLRLLALSNEGLNLWVVERPLIGLTQNQGTYVLPSGTLDLLNVVYSTPSLVSGTNSVLPQSVTVELENSAGVVRVGLKFDSISAAETITLSSSPDGVTYTDFLVLSKTDWMSGEWYWLSLDPWVENTWFKVSSTTGNIDVANFELATTVSDIRMTAFNRDDYMNQPNKSWSGRPCTNYYFEKLINPQVTLWPLPNNSTDHLSLIIHRQVQDVGTINQNLQVPPRWMEAITWQLADSLATLLPDVAPDRIMLCNQMAQSSLLQVEKDETDGAPIRFSPAIRGYTR